VASFHGQLSGGTLATGIEMGRDYPEHRTRAEDPFCMGGGTGALRDEDADQEDAVFDEDLQVWTQPWQMQAINTRVVRKVTAHLHTCTPAHLLASRHSVRTLTSLARCAVGRLAPLRPRLLLPGKGARCCFSWQLNWEL
jgi:hypothetical protein